MSGPENPLTKARRGQRLLADSIVLEAAFLGRVCWAVLIGSLHQKCPSMVPYSNFIIGE